MTGLWEAIRAGLELGLAFNPLTAALGAAASAAYVAADLRARRVVGAAMLAAAWLLGDGLRIIGRAREIRDGVATILPATAPAWADWVALGLWAVIGITAGYAWPSWAGAYAGRRTILGWDWLVAGSVALTVALALSALAGGLGR